MRTSLLSALLLVACTLPAAAQEKSKPNTLTPQEIAEGWILLFDGKTTFGWEIDGNVKVMDGTLILGGDRATKAFVTTVFPEAFEFRLDCRSQGSGKSQLRVIGQHSRSTFGIPDAWAEQWFKCRREGPDHVVKVVSKFKGAGVGTAGTSANVPNQRSSFKLVLDVPQSTQVEIRDFKLRPSGMQPLFNGKDLTGWKVFPGKKSEFTVADGAIQVKNGPGDLQTEGKYGDFILQLECKSNGKHLNSGVFFRCKANEYQNGYEAQIHNGFASDKMKDYTVEEYDPRTHERTGKKKVQSAALDYGTGAIYRRVPARFQASKDGEWFTLTVVAHGNHFATWVNGVQQVDWYDNRPRSDNPRTGCRLEPGHLSIQGHDPTTDLSFRNLRLAELPAGK